MRPMSCVTSINDYNRQNSVRYPLDDALNEVKSDKFIERLNAMLHQNNIGQEMHPVGEVDHFSSASCNNLARAAAPTARSFSNSEVLSRSSSAYCINQNQGESSFDGGNSSHRYGDFSVQIQEQGAKNVKAQQKLRQLQAEQMSQFASGSSSGNFSQAAKSTEHESQERRRI